MPIQMENALGPVFSLDRRRWTGHALPHLRPGKRDALAENANSSHLIINSRLATFCLASSPTLTPTPTPTPTPSDSPKVHSLPLPLLAPTLASVCLWRQPASQPVSSKQRPKLSSLSAGVWPAERKWAHARNTLSVGPIVVRRLADQQTGRLLVQLPHSASSPLSRFGPSPIGGEFQNQHQLSEKAERPVRSETSLGRSAPLGQGVRACNAECLQEAVLCGLSFLQEPLRGGAFLFRFGPTFLQST